MEAVRSWIELSRYGRFSNWSVRLAQASLCCFWYLCETHSSNHCGNMARWSCSFLSNSLITSGAQCAGNHRAESSYPVTHASCVILGIPVSCALELRHNFDKPAAGPLSLSLYASIVPRGSTQQLLVNGLYPIVGAEEMDVFFISEGGTLICKYYGRSLPQTQQDNRQA